MFYRSILHHGFLLSTAADGRMNGERGQLLASSCSARFPEMIGGEGATNALAYQQASSNEDDREAVDAVLCLCPSVTRSGDKEG